ncbi:HotDog domain-containing protein [Pterulicium gracile]|uniref:HotDog domain-containing protein n=1 Tax=Pterulicium gracile TaxID=1884261 RepID=A0A5C3QH78_9AGAR|nr:HotDog domain-containing protein [Pterula gracilis]
MSLRLLQRSLPRASARSLRSYSSSKPTLQSATHPPSSITPSSPASSSDSPKPLDLESELQSLPLLKSHRALAPSFYELRAYADVPPHRRANHLSAHTLSGPGKLGVAPLVRCKEDDSECVVFVHLGEGLCGHQGIVHGGLMATLLDEALSRTACNNLPSKVGVTANLTIEYRAPTKADQVSSRSYYL